MTKPLIPKDAKDNFSDPRVLFWDRNDQFQVEVQITQSWEDPYMRIGNLCVWNLKNNQDLLAEKIVIPRFITDEVKQKWKEMVIEVISSKKR